MSNYEIKIVPLSADQGGGYAALVPKLPGCMSDGDTEMEALNNALAAIDDWLAEAKRLGRPIPDPEFASAAFG